MEQPKLTNQQWDYIYRILDYERYNRAKIGQDFSQVEEILKEIAPYLSEVMNNAISKNST